MELKPFMMIEVFKYNEKQIRKRSNPESMHSKYVGSFNIFTYSFFN